MTCNPRRGVRADSVCDVGVRRFRIFVGCLVCLGLPLGSWVLSEGALAYTMYAATVAYRLEVVGYDSQGRPAPIAPTELARYASPFAAPFLYRADEPRELPQITALRAHLADVGRLACAHSTSSEVHVTLFEGAVTDALLSPTKSASVPCAEAR
jgi:hypothetical protein